MDHTLSSSRRAFIAGSIAIAMATGPARAAVSGGPAVVGLMAPDGREVSVTEWKPKGRPRGIILFSHGAGSSPKEYDLFIGPWVLAGWRVLAPLHVDSRDHPLTAKFTGLSSWKARVEDMRLLIAHIGSAPYVAVGHSYGGLTALMLGGAQPVVPEGLQAPLASRVARAVIAFSPPAPIPVLVTDEGYGKLAVPALIQTGTLDILRGPGSEVAASWEGHLAPFRAASPGGHRYGLVLEGADHYFGGLICDPTKPGPPQTSQIQLASQRAGLFLAGFGAGNAKARRNLDALLTEQFPARLMKR